MADLRFNVSAETRAATAAMGGFAQSMQRDLVNAVRALPNIELTADASDAQREMRAIRDELAALANKRVGIDIDAADAVAEAERLQARLNDLAGSTTDVQIRADAGQASGALDQVLDRARQVDGADAEVEVTADTGEAEAEIGRFTDGAKATAAAAGVAIGAVLAQGFSSAMEAETMTATLEAKLAGTGPISEVAGEVAGRLYADKYGESMGEVGEAVAAVAQGIKGMSTASADDLQRVTGQAMSLSSTFGQDLTSTVRAVDQMMRTGMAPSAEAALDILTKGFQSGVNEADDLLDTFAEYSTQFRKFGLDGQTATGMLQQGLQAGARDADIVADAIKEFSIRAIDGSELTAQSFEELGLSAEEMTGKIARGGPEAAGALDMTLDRLRSVQDPTDRARIAVGLFGTQAEDLGEALFALDPSQATQRLGEFTGAAADLDAAIGATAEAKVGKLQRAFEQWTQSLIATEGPIGDVAAMIAAFGPMAAGVVTGLAPLLLALKMGGIADAIRSGPGAAIDDLDGRADRASRGGVGRLGGALKFAGAAAAIGLVGVAIDGLNEKTRGTADDMLGYGEDLHEFAKIAQGDFTEIQRMPDDISSEWDQMVANMQSGQAPIAAGVVPMAAMVRTLQDGTVESGEFARELGNVKGQADQVWAAGQAGGTALEQAFGRSLQAVQTNFTALTDVIGNTVATFDVDADSNPARDKVTTTVTFANGETGVMTLAANGQPAMIELAGTKYAVDTETGVMTIQGNPAPGMANLNGFRLTADRTTGVMQITARDAGAYQTALAIAAAMSTVRAVIRVVAAPFGHDGMIYPATGFAAGGISAAGFAGGGMATPFAAGTAQVFGPNRLRFTGDRSDVDEFYLPDNSDPRTMAIGSEWAARRGLALVSGTAARAGSAMATAAGRAPAGGGSSPAFAAVVTELRALRSDLAAGNYGSRQLAALNTIAGALRSGASPATARAQAGLAASRDGAW